jgi:hypothetical protein
MDNNLNQELYLDLTISCGKRPKDYLKRKEFFKTFSTFKEIDNNEFCVRLCFDDLLKMRDSDYAGALGWVGSSYELRFNSLVIKKGYDKNIYEIPFSHRIIKAFLDSCFSRTYERQIFRIGISFHIKTNGAVLSEEKKNEISGEDLCSVFYERYFNDKSPVEIYEIFINRDQDLFKKYDLMVFNSKTGNNILDYLTKEYCLDRIRVRYPEDLLKEQEKETKKKAIKLFNISDIEIVFDGDGFCSLKYNDEETTSLNYTYSANNEFLVVYDRGMRPENNNLFLIKNDKKLIYRIPIKEIHDLYLSNNGEILALLYQNEKHFLAHIDISGNVLETARESEFCYFRIEELENFLGIKLNSLETLRSILNRGREDWCMMMESQAKEKYKF